MSEATRERQMLPNPLKLSSLLACHTLFPTFPLSRTFSATARSCMILRHEANKRLPQNKIFVLCPFHMLYTMFIMEYIYLENLHFNSMAILVVTFSGSLTLWVALHLFFRRVSISLANISTMGFVHTQCTCVRARVLYALRLE